jgi:energy-coupling factor transport system permease protein
MRFAFHRDVALGRFVPLDTPVHRMDPRTKLVVFVVFLLALLRAHGPASWLLAAAAFGGAALARLPLRRVAGGLRALTWILAITIAYHALWIGRTGPGVVAGAAQGVEAALELVAMLVAAAALTHATEPVRLADGLAQLLGFLERLRVPVRDFALVLTLALRFLPTVMEEAQRIVLAQRARGAVFAGGPLARGRRFLPLAVPLFAGCLRRADTLALAMEARGYASSRRRTQLEPLGFRTIDAWTLLGAAAILAASLALSR